MPSLRLGCAPSKLHRLPHPKRSCGGFRRFVKRPPSPVTLPSPPLISTERASHTRYPRALRRRTLFAARPFPCHHKANRLDFPNRPAPAKRSPSTGDDLISRSGSVPCQAPLRGLLLPVPGIQTDPPAHLRTPENAAGIDETRSTRELRGQQRRNNSAGWTGTRRGTWTWQAR